MTKSNSRATIVARTCVAVILGGLLSACALRGNLALDDHSAVQSPVYTANKVLFFDHPKPPVNADDPGRYDDLIEGYQIAQKEAARRESKKDPEQARANDEHARRSVRNRQPLSIVVSRAFLPLSTKTCKRRMSDLAFGKGRDIAVLLDTATAASGNEFIAVWYQRDVMPGETLNFQDLLVHATSAWDSKFPPQFRLRLVDVSTERNTALGGLLDRVRGSSNAITGALGAGEVSPIIGIAALAARQVLAHENNASLVDFTFQLYSANVLGASGGMPLGVLQTGGLIVTAPPCGQGNKFWENSYRFDHRLNRMVDKDKNVEDVPYIVATIITADLAVPDFVRVRSNAIMERLTNPAIAQAELASAQADADKLLSALKLLNEREVFRKSPSKDKFKYLVGKINDEQDLDLKEVEYFRNYSYQITKVNLSNFQDYVDWIGKCSANADFDEEIGEYVRDPAVRGGGNRDFICWES